MEETRKEQNDVTQTHLANDEQQKNSLKRFMRHYLDLFPIMDSKLTTREIQKLDNFFKGVDLSSINNMLGKTLTIVYNSPSAKSCFAYLLTKLPYLSEAKFLTLQDILDMQFSNHPIYSSVRDVRTPIVLIYIESVTNRLKDEYLLKAIEYWTMKGSTVWIYFKGTGGDMVKEFPKTVAFSKSHRITATDLNT